MKIELCEENLAAEENLSAEKNDRSGVGVHYVDAYIKPMNTKLDDGTKISFKRRGVKVNVAIGKTKGFGLMRRYQVSPDPKIMLRSALEDAAKEVNASLIFEDGKIFLDAEI